MGFLRKEAEQFLALDALPRAAQVMAPLDGTRDENRGNTDAICPRMRLRDRPCTVGR